MEIPKFAFKSPLSEAEIIKDEEQAKVKDPKMFKPGSYDMKIISAEYHKPMQGDATWHGYKLRLGVGDTRSIGLYVAVPTNGPMYNKPGMDPKHKMIMFHKFREFVKGIGEDSSVDSLGKTIDKLFSNPAKLVGKPIQIDVGYKGPYAEFVEKGVFKFVDKTGKELSPEKFSDRDSVKAYAASLGKVTEDFTDIVRIHPKEVKKKEESTDPWGE